MFFEMELTSPAPLILLLPPIMRGHPKGGGRSVNPGGQQPGKGVMWWWYKFLTRDNQNYELYFVLKLTSIPEK